MKKFFSLVLALVMALSLSTMAWGATTVTTVDQLKAAVAAGGEIVLGNNIEGDGIVIDKSVTIDLNGFSYTINGETVGSSHTETIGMQIKESAGTVVIKNGSIIGSDAATKPASTCGVTGCTATGHTDVPIPNYGVKMVIQNYADLTLDGVTVTGNSKAGYVVSNNCGDVVIEDTTINAAAGNVAFDVCDYSTYTGVFVTVKGNSVINGKIELSDSNTGDSDVTKLVIENGEINGAIDVATSGMTEDVTISGGTFSVAPKAAYLDTGLSYVGGAVVATGATVTSDRYDMVTTDAAQTKTMGVAIGTFAAKNPTYNADGISVADGNVAYVVFSNMPGKTFVQVNTQGQADYTVYKAGTTTLFGYFDEVVNPFYHGNGVAFYNFGKACTQYKDANFDATAKYYTFEGNVYKAVSALDANAGNLMVNNTLVPVSTTSGAWVGHTVAYTYDKDFKVTAVTCSACGAVATIVPNYMSLPEQAIVDGTFGGPINTTMYYYWTNAVVKPVTPTTPSTDKVTSADTFDAGIAMYVGMSVMAAAGSAVVIGKKKD